MPADLRNVDLPAAAMVTLLGFLWAGNPIAIKIGLPDAPPIRQAWMRFVLGGFSVLSWARLVGTSFRVPRHERRPLLILGLLFTAQIALHNLGLATPVFGVFQSWLIPGETLTVRLLVSAALVVGGIALASRPSAPPDRRLTAVPQIEDP